MEGGRSAGQLGWRPGRHVTLGARAEHEANTCDGQKPRHPRVGADKKTRCFPLALSEFSEMAKDSPTRCLAPVTGETRMAI
jgi:hypothetical protein